MKGLNFFKNVGENTKNVFSRHKLIIILLGIIIFLVLLIVVVIGGGSDDCSSGDSGASGNWGWPFDGVKDPPQALDGGKFGDSAASASVRKGHTFHDGFDWSFGLNGVHSGSTVKAVHDGTVTRVAYANGLDYYVWVHSDDGYNEVYQETFDKDDIKVHEGQHVNCGDTIGTAHLNGHMHLGITKENDFGKAELKAFTNDGTWLDPIKTIEDGMKSSSSKGGSGGSGAGVTGDWTRAGTKAYETAKAVFEGWVSIGMSGAEAAGIVGNIGGAEDTGFVLNQAEIGGGSGGGLYQFTPSSKYLNDKKSDKSWSVKNQQEVVMDLEPGTINGYFQRNKNSSAADCATDWMNSYERPSPYARSQTNSARRAAAEKAYILFGGADIKAKDSLLGVAANGAGLSINGTSDNPDCDDGVDAGSADGNIVDVAKSLLGYFHYGQVHGTANIGSVDHPNRNGVTDCSGFVWLVLTKAGYKTPANMGWFTGSMAADAKGSHQWLKQISPNEAQAGDVIICNTGSGAGNAGHTAILEESWKGGNTKVIEEGGSGGSGGVNESNVSMAFGSLFTNGETVIARPIKK